MIVHRTWKHRIYPSLAQEEALTTQLHECARLYNAALRERTDAYQICKKSISYYEQKRAFTEIRHAGDTGIVNCWVGQQVLKRVDSALQAFFRRVKAGQTPGYPRFRSPYSYNSLTYSWENGCYFKGAKLYAQGIGNLKIRLDRAIQGKIKTITLKREAARWYAVFSCEVDVRALPISENTVGLDVGLKSFVATSDGEVVDAPQFYRKTQVLLRTAQRKLSRCKKGSLGWAAARAKIQKIHAKIKNQRQGFHHGLSKAIVKDNGLIAVEDLNVKRLQRGMLSKSVSDAGWSSFFSQLEYKALAAGRCFVKVDPRGTSQTCTCGASVPKTLRIREHKCEVCGVEMDRDVMSAQVILQRALSGRNAAMVR